MIHCFRRENMSHQQGHLSSQSTASNTTSISDEDTLISDAESSRSCCTRQFPREIGLLGNDLIDLEEGSRNYCVLKRMFLSGIGSTLARQVTIDAMLKNAHSSLQGKARLRAFSIYSSALEKQQHDNANIKYAWYTASYDGICRIIQHGFSHLDVNENGGIFGCGLYLSPACCSIESLVRSTIDENKHRYLLLCQVILGNQEVIIPGSKQCYPSSTQFNSGVDNLVAPKKYVIWSVNMNTHVLPEYIVCFTLHQGSHSTEELVMRPTSDWIPLQNLKSVLLGILPPPSMKLIERNINDFKARKITRPILIWRLRQIAGDKLLEETIKTFRAKLGQAMVASLKKWSDSA